MSGEYKVPLFLYRPRCVIELDWSLNRFRLIHLHSPGTAPPAPGWWSVLGGNTLHEINAFDQHCLPIRVNGLFLWNIQLKIFRRANFALGAIHKPRGDGCGGDGVWQLSTLRNGDNSKQVSMLFMDGPLASEATWAKFCTSDSDSHNISGFSDSTELHSITSSSECRKFTITSESYRTSDLVRV